MSLPLRALEDPVVAWQLGTPATTTNGIHVDVLKLLPAGVQVNGSLGERALRPQALVSSSTQTALSFKETNSFRIPRENNFLIFKFNRP
jgi:hypothetical protein